jgi:hypothetical protein
MAVLINRYENKPPQSQSDDYYRELGEVASVGGDTFTDYPVSPEEYTIQFEQGLEGNIRDQFDSERKIKRNANLNTLASEAVSNGDGLTAIVATEASQVEVPNQYALEQTAVQTISDEDRIDPYSNESLLHVERGDLAFALEEEAVLDMALRKKIDSVKLEVDAEGITGDIKAVLDYFEAPLATAAIESLLPEIGSFKDLSRYQQMTRIKEELRNVLRTNPDEFEKRLDAFVEAAGTAGINSKNSALLLLQEVVKPEYSPVRDAFNIYTVLEAPVVFTRPALTLGTSAIVGAGALINAGYKVGANAFVKSKIVQDIVKEGKTAKEVLQAAENAMPSAVSSHNGIVKSAIPAVDDADTAQRIVDRFNEIHTPSTVLTEEEVTKALENTQKYIKEHSPIAKNIMDVPFDQEVVDVMNQQLTYENSAAMYKMKLGKTSGAPFSSEASAKAFMTRNKIDGKLEATTNGYFIDYQIPLDISGAISGKLIDSGNSISTLYKRTIGGSRLLHAGNSFERLLITEGAESRVRNEILLPWQKEMETALKSTEDAQAFEVLLQRINEKNMTRWPSKTEIHTMLSSIPHKNTDKVLKAYEYFKPMRDKLHQLQLNADYNQLASHGYKTGKFVVEGEELTMNMKPVALQSLNNKLVYDVAHQKVITLTSEMAENAKLYKFNDADTMLGGFKVQGILDTVENVAISDLRKNSLDRGYRAGYSRKFASRFFLKQAAKDSEGNLIKPRTHGAYMLNNKASAAAEQLNELFDIAKAGLVKQGDRLRAEELIQGTGIADDLDDFMTKVADKEIDIDTAIEVVPDQGLPSAYKGGDFDFIESGSTVNNWRGDKWSKRTNARLIGDDVDGLAATLSPFDSLSNEINTVIKRIGYQNYRNTAVNEWFEGAQQYLTKELRDNPWAALDNPRFVEDISANTKALIMAQRNGIRSALSIPSEQARVYKEWMRQFASAMDDRGFDRTANFFYNAADSRPVQALKGMTYNLTLGLWRVDQYLLQTQTAISARLSDPEVAMPAWFAGWPARMANSWIKTNGIERLDEFLDTAKSMKLLDMPGVDKETATEAIKAYVKSGFGNVKYTQVEVADLASDYNRNLLSRASTKIGEAGRVILDEAEVTNRSTAYLMAYMREAKNAGKAKLNQEQLSRVASRASGYAMDMTKAGATPVLREGLPSMLTQFISYRQRFIERVLFGGKELNGAQRANLLAAQFYLYGVEGTALSDMITSMLVDPETNDISPEGEKALKYIEAGLVGGMVAAFTGADVSFDRARVFSGATDTLKAIISLDFDKTPVWTTATRWGDSIAEQVAEFEASKKSTIGEYGIGILQGVGAVLSDNIAIVKV